MIQITIHAMNRGVVKICILVFLILGANVLPRAAAEEAHVKIGQPKVVLNANFAGCIKPSIMGYSLDRGQVYVSLKIIKDVNFSEGPCVCRGGLCYFQVYPSDTALPQGRAWMYAKSYYKADLAFGVLPSKPYVMPHLEQIRFPSFKNRNGQAFAWYYVAIGCP